MIGIVKLPFDRARMSERNRLDLHDELAALSRMTPEQRWTLGLELSELALQLHRSATAGAQARSETLQAKARYWTLRRLEGTG